MFEFLRRKPSNPGLLWLDEPSARRALDARWKAREISEEERTNLAKFSDDGYFIIPIDLTAEDAAEFQRDVERLWDEKPHDLAFAYDSPPRRFSEAVEENDRKPRYRIHEMHASSAVARRLYLHPLLHRYASLILGETAVATQSLYFEFGSQQALHRDSIVVPTPEFGRLVAAWIALEDISPESGPLVYVPGSQKFPFYEFQPGQYVYDPTKHSGVQVETAMAYYAAELERSRLPVKQFLARRGEVLIWHSALMHGGAAAADERKTRKSFVVHYSTLRHHPTRECAVAEDVDGSAGESVYSTAEVLESNGAHGFANPLNGSMKYRR